MAGVPRQVVVLSLPNSGTDWLCPILARYCGLRYYDKEFFAPICNPTYGDVLETAFGCELVSCYRNIGIRAEDQMGDLEFLYRETWARQAWAFDKENFSAFKVGFFARHFRIAFLYRPAADVFPPSRLRVWCWYDAIWNALADAGHVRRRTIPLDRRAWEAHRVSWDAMMAHPNANGAPILSYQLLCTADAEQVRSHLAQSWLADVLDSRAAAAEILLTRRYLAKR